MSGFTFPRIQDSSVILEEEKESDESDDPFGDFFDEAMDGGEEEKQVVEEDKHVEEKPTKISHDGEKLKKASLDLDESPEMSKFDKIMKSRENVFKEDKKPLKSKKKGYKKPKIKAQEKKHHGSEDEDDYSSEAEDWDRPYNSDSCLYDPKNRPDLFGGDEKNKVNLGEFEMLKKIGEGGYGYVMLVRKKKTGDYYALKIIRFKDDVDEGFMENLVNERNIFQIVSGEHVVTAHFSFIHKNYVCFAMEFMPGGDFGDLLKEEQYLDERTEAKHYAAELVLAIEYMHKMNIIHRDLKPDNILIDRYGHIKLADFGLSDISKKYSDRVADQDISLLQADFGLKEISDLKEFKMDEIRKKEKKERKKKNKKNRKESTYPELRDAEKKKKLKEKDRVVGTPDYMPPEVLNLTSEKHPTIDWWALGCLIYEFVIGEPPFHGESVEEVFSNIRAYGRGEFKIQWPEIGYEDGKLSPGCQNLIKRLLNPDWKKRLGFGGSEEIKKHKFFKDIKWDKIKKDKNTPFYYDYSWQYMEMMSKLEKIEGQAIKLDGIFTKNKDQKVRKHIDTDKFMLVRTDLLDKKNKEQYYDYKESLDKFNDEENDIKMKIDEIRKRNFMLVII